MIYSQTVLKVVLFPFQEGNKKLPFEMYAQPVSKKKNECYISVQGGERMGSIIPHRDAAKVIQLEICQTGTVGFSR